LIYEVKDELLDKEEATRFTEASAYAGVPSFDVLYVVLSCFDIRGCFQDLNP